MPIESERYYYQLIRTKNILIHPHISDSTTEILPIGQHLNNAPTTNASLATTTTTSSDDDDDGDNNDNGDDPTLVLNMHHSDEPTLVLNVGSVEPTLVLNVPHVCNILSIVSRICRNFYNCF